MQPINKIIKEIVKDRRLDTGDDLYRKTMHDQDVLQFLKANKSKISQASFQNSLPNLYQFYLQKQNPDKVIKGYRPELFMNGKIIDIRYAPTAAKRELDREKNTRRHLELISLPKSLYEVKLSDVDWKKNDDRSEAMNGLYNFIRTYSRHPHQKGLYLTGDFGVGKTFMLAGLANSIASLGKKVVFLHVPTFIASLTSHFDDNSLQDEIRKVAEADLLILDDIGAESLSQWSRDDVLGVILQARMDNVLPTFFSSNLDMEALQSHFEETRNAIDPVKARRLMQRIRFLAKEVVVKGPDRRNSLH